MSYSDPATAYARAVEAGEIVAAPVTHIRRQPLARIDVHGQTFTLGNQTVPLNVVVAAMREAGMDVVTNNVATIKVKAQA